MPCGGAGACGLLGPARLPPTGDPAPLPRPTAPPRLPTRRYAGYRYGLHEGRPLQFLLYRRSRADDNHYA